LLETGELKAKSWQRGRRVGRSMK